MSAAVPIFRAARRRQTARLNMEARIDALVASSQILREEATGTLEAITTRTIQNHIAEAIAAAFAEMRH